jgi:hypothetical protein
MAENYYWNKFRDSLNESIKCIEKSYFRIERDTPEEGSFPVWRERAYCYELYSQIKCHLPPSFPYKLHGEIDKRGHDNIESIFKTKGIEAPNPDFVLHKPGSTDNLAVIEVKIGENDRLKPEGCKRDLEKLEVFIKDIKYTHGVFLIFGGVDSYVIKIIEENITDNQRELLKEKKLHIVWHEIVGKYPHCITISSSNGHDRLIIQNGK